MSTLGNFRRLMLLRKRESLRNSGDTVCFGDAIENGYVLSEILVFARPATVATYLVVLNFSKINFENVSIKFEDGNMSENSQVAKIVLDSLATNRIDEKVNVSFGFRVQACQVLVLQICDNTDY